jgi:hypothetical protein
MTIGALAAGTPPETVVPRAADAVRTLATVEASDLAVVSGSARVTVRFTGEDDDGARRVAAHAVAELASAAEVVTSRITRRDGPRWSPVYTG